MARELWERLFVYDIWERYLDQEPTDVPWSRAEVLATNRLCAPASELAIESAGSLRRPWTM